MSTEITVAFKNQYRASFELKYQQMPSMLEGTVRNESQQGEVGFWDFIGEVAPVWDLPRHADTPQIDTPHTRRALKLHSAEWADLIDEDDKIQTLVDPTSDYIRVAVAAMNRAKDERILEALGGAVLTGKAGTTSVNFYDVGESRVINGTGTLIDAGSDAGATTETGLTIDKIGLCGLLLDEASVPMEGRTIVANAWNKTYLLGSTRVTSSDYATVKALARGEIDTWMGFTFKWLPTDRFQNHAVDVSGIECFAYHRDAVLLAIAKDVTTKVDTLPGKRYSVQPYAKMRIGSTRLQGPGVVKMVLAPSPTLDFTQA